MSGLSRQEVLYLEAVEVHSFVPIGWLYRSIYEGLLQRGLVSRTVSDGFILSDDGAKALAAYRESKGTP